MSRKSTKKYKNNPFPKINLDVSSIYRDALNKESQAVAKIMNEHKKREKIAYDNEISF